MRGDAGSDRRENALASHADRGRSGRTCGRELGVGQQPLLVILEGRLAGGACHRAIADDVQLRRDLDVAAHVWEGGRGGRPENLRPVLRAVGQELWLEEKRRVDLRVTRSAGDDRRYAVDRLELVVRIDEPRRVDPGGVDDTGRGRVGGGTVWIRVVEKHVIRRGHIDAAGPRPHHRRQIDCDGADGVSAVVNRLRVGGLTRDDHARRLRQVRIAQIVDRIVVRIVDGGSERCHGVGIAALEVGARGDAVGPRTRIGDGKDGGALSAHADAVCGSAVRGANIELVGEQVRRRDILGGRADDIGGGPIGGDGTRGIPIEVILEIRRRWDRINSARVIGIQISSQRREIGWVEIIAELEESVGNRCSDNDVVHGPQCQRSRLDRCAEPWSIIRDIPVVERHIALLRARAAVIDLDVFVAVDSVVRLHIGLEIVGGARRQVPGALDGDIAGVGIGIGIHQLDSRPHMDDTCAEIQRERVERVDQVLESVVLQSVVLSPGALAERHQRAVEKRKVRSNGLEDFTGRWSAGIGFCSGEGVVLVKLEAARSRRAGQGRRRQEGAERTLGRLAKSKDNGWGEGGEASVVVGGYVDHLQPARGDDRIYRGSLRRGDVRTK